MVRKNVSAFSWFSASQLALTGGERGALSIVELEDLTRSVIDSAIEPPENLKALCRGGEGDGAGVTALGKSASLLLIKPCMSEEVLQQMLDANDFQGALQFCARKNISRGTCRVCIL
jgi:hypothetical protein